MSGEHRVVAHAARRVAASLAGAIALLVSLTACTAAEDLAVVATGEAATASLHAEVESGRDSTSAPLGESLPADPEPPELAMVAAAPPGPPTLPLVVEGVTSVIRGEATISGWASPDDAGSTVTAEVSVTSDTVNLTKPITVTVGSDRAFSVSIDDLTPGPQTLCLGAECRRVFVAETTIESDAVIESRILEAMIRANQLFDFETALPEWRVVVGGVSTGAGGHYQPANKTILIHGTSGRTIDDFVATILHEVGHALEYERLTDNERAAYQAMRGIDPQLAWSPAELAPDERWASPAEDFADMFVVLTTDGAHQTRSDLATQPTPDELAAFAQFLGWVD